MNAKLFILAILFSLSNLTFSQGNEKITHADYNVSDQVALLQVSHLVVSENDLGLNPSSIEVFTFKNGLLTEKQYMIPNSYASKQTFTYNGANELISSTFMNGTSSGSGESKTTYEKSRTKNTEEEKVRDETIGTHTYIYRTFDDNGNLLKKEVMNADRETSAVIEYGNQTRKEIEFKEGTPTSEVVYKLDANGNLVRTRSGLTEADYFKITDFLYNDKGDLITELSYYSKQGVQEPYTHIKMYDYLYQGDYWVARAEYSNTAIDKTTPIIIRGLQDVAGKQYAITTEQEVKSFATQVFGKYDSLKQKLQQHNQ